MKIIDMVRQIYWKILPYEYRPGHLLYRLKCRFWLRYSTVKPRHLPHTWCDRCVLMPHAMFEILCQFIEQECSPGYVNWYGEHGPKIEVNGKQEFVMDEMLDLMHWWKVQYNDQLIRLRNTFIEIAHKYSPEDMFTEVEGTGFYRWTLHWDNPNREVMYRRFMKAADKLEEEVSKSLQRNMHRLVNVAPYMWT